MICCRSESTDRQQIITFVHLSRAIVIRLFSYLAISSTMFTALTVAAASRPNPDPQSRIEITNTYINARQFKRHKTSTKRLPVTRTNCGADGADGNSLSGAGVGGNGGNSGNTGDVVGVAVSGSGTGGAAINVGISGNSSPGGTGGNGHGGKGGNASGSNGGQCQR
jgi:hypothetical protein